MTKEKIALDDLTDDKACPVAQMCKRMISDDFERHSANAAKHNHIDHPTRDGRSLRSKLILVEGCFARSVHGLYAGCAVLHLKPVPALAERTCTIAAAKITVRGLSCRKANLGRLLSRRRQHRRRSCRRRRTLVALTRMMCVEVGEPVLARTTISPSITKRSRQSRSAAPTISRCT
jgi:hypothetical protein